MGKKRQKKPKIKRPKFKVFRLEDNKWRWLLEANNGKLYAQCGHSYLNKRDCVSAVKNIRNLASACEIVVED